MAFFRIALSCLALTVASAGNAQETFPKPKELGTKIERKPFVRIPVRSCVTRIHFSPDRNETWCLAGWSGVRRGDARGRALVFDKKRNNWANLPSPTDPAVFHDVAFSANGKSTWIAMSSDEDRSLRVRKRAVESEWHSMDNMPADYSVVEKFWHSPNSKELWMYTSDCGLIRLDLGKDKPIQYVKSDFRQFEKVPHRTLNEDYVADLVFTSDSKYAICAASGGGDYGLTKINLSNDVSKPFPVNDAIDFEKLVMAPNDKHVWCVGNNSYLWCFDIESETWIHKCSSHDDMPLSMIDTLVCSPDSRHIWISGTEGIACYSLHKKTWTNYSNPDWYSDHALPAIATVPLVVTSNGRHIISGKGSGVALFDVDGGLVATIESDEPTNRSSCTHIVPIPNTPNFLCSLEFDSGRGGLYLLKTGTRNLKRLFTLNAPATALAISHSNNTWLAMPGFIYELDWKNQKLIQKHSLSVDAAQDVK